MESFYIRGSDLSAVCAKNRYQPVGETLFKKIHDYNNLHMSQSSKEFVARYYFKYI